MSHACPRTWEVAAERDGRLGGDAAVDLESHLDRCEDCRRERVALEDLSLRLRRASSGDLDDLSLRRLRARTLEAAGAAKLAAEGASRRSPASMASMAFAMLTFAVVLAFGVMLLLRGDAAHEAAQLPATPASVPTASPSSSATSTQVVATEEGNARWSSHDEPETRRIHLQEGTLRLVVNRPLGGKRLVVEVPDGEIEDLGTTFRVEVGSGRTRRVQVDEGSVVIRLRGLPPITLERGESWEAAPLASPPATSPSTRSSRAAATASAPPSTSPSTMDAGLEDEDHAYVEIVRLLRDGREAEARAAAHEYLRRYPTGFRRAEVERVLARP